MRLAIAAIGTVDSITTALGEHQHQQVAFECGTDQDRAEYGHPQQADCASIVSTSLVLDCWFMVGMLTVDHALKHCRNLPTKLYYFRVNGTKECESAFEASKTA